jgi:hypothetical protein
MLMEDVNVIDFTAYGFVSNTPKIFRFKTPLKIAFRDIEYLHVIENGTENCTVYFNLKHQNSLEQLNRLFANSGINTVDNVSMSTKCPNLMLSDFKKNANKKTFVMICNGVVYKSYWTMILELIEMV